MYVCMYGKFIFNGQLNFCFQISQIEKMIIIRLDSKENHHHHCNHIKKEKKNWIFIFQFYVVYPFFALLCFKRQINLIYLYINIKKEQMSIEFVLRTFSLSNN
mgnify:CR=1 FL=1